MAVSLRCGWARRRRLILRLQRERIMTAVIRSDQRQNRDRADNGEEVREDEAHERDDRDEGEDRPEKRLIPFRLLGEACAACAEIAVYACTDALTDVAHDVVVQLAMKVCAPGMPVVAPLV